jgi:SHS2 domain-containing protein
MPRRDAELDSGARTVLADDAPDSRTFGRCDALEIERGGVAAGDQFVSFEQAGGHRRETSWVRDRTNDRHPEAQRVAAHQGRAVTAVAAIDAAYRTAEAIGMTDRWEHFAHGADIGVRGFGATKAAAFEQAALALTGVVTDVSTVASQEAVEIRCESPDDEMLLADWLNAIVYEMAVRNMLFGRYEVQIDGTRLQARAWGEPASVARHHPAVEVKGATYTALRVAPDEQGGWVAQTVVDV